MFDASPKNSARSTLQIDTAVPTITADRARGVDLFDFRAEYDHFQESLATLPVTANLGRNGELTRFVHLGLFARIASRLFEQYGRYPTLTEGNNLVELLPEVPADPRLLREISPERQVIIIRDKPLPAEFFEALTESVERVRFRDHMEFRMIINAETGPAQQTYNHRLSRDMRLFVQDDDQSHLDRFWSKILTLRSLGYGLYGSVSDLRSTVKVLAHPSVRTAKSQKDLRKRGGLHLGHNQLGNYIAGTPTILSPYERVWSARPDSSTIGQNILEIGPSCEDAILESLLQTKFDEFTDRYASYVDTVFRVLDGRGFFLEGLVQIPEGSFVLFNASSNNAGLLHSVSFNFTQGRLRAIMSWHARLPQRQ